MKVDFWRIVATVHNIISFQFFVACTHFLGFEPFLTLNASQYSITQQIFFRLNCIFGPLTI